MNNSNGGGGVGGRKNTTLRTAIFMLLKIPEIIRNFFKISIY